MAKEHVDTNGINLMVNLKIHATLLLVPTLSWAGLSCALLIPSKVCQQDMSYRYHRTWATPPINHYGQYYYRQWKSLSTTYFGRCRSSPRARGYSVSVLSSQHDFHDDRQLLLETGRRCEDLGLECSPALRHDQELALELHGKHRQESL